MSDVRAHEREGFTCWCDPIVKGPCRECDPDQPTPGCWRCGGSGLVRLANPHEDEGPFLIIHRFPVPENAVIDWSP